jgi:hypothetical protein
MAYLMTEVPKRCEPHLLAAHEQATKIQKENEEVSRRRKETEKASLRNEIAATLQDYPPRPMVRAPAEISHEIASENSKQKVAG